MHVVIRNVRILPSSPLLSLSGLSDLLNPTSLSQCISTLQSQPSWPSLPLSPLLRKSYRKIPFRRTVIADPKLVIPSQCIIAAPWQAMGVSSIQVMTGGSHWTSRLEMVWLSKGELSFLRSSLVDCGLGSRRGFEMFR